MYIWVSIAYLELPMSDTPDTMLCFAGLVGSVSVGSFISSNYFDPKEPLSLLQMYLVILLWFTQNSAAAVFDPWLKYTSSSPGVGAVYLLLAELTADTYGLTWVFSILAIMAYSFSEFEETLLPPSIFLW